MYINKLKISSVKTVTMLLLIVVGILGAFWLIISVCALAGDEKLEKYTLAYCMFLAVHVSAFVLLFKKYRFIGNLRRMDNVFQGDTDGIIMLDKASAVMGMTEAEFVRLFNNGVAKGYIINAHLNNEKELCIILTNPNTKSKPDLSDVPDTTEIKCANCGATNKAALDSESRCQFCGARLILK